MRTRETRTIISRVLFISLVVCLFIWTNYRRISNPDMTETRLFLTFWEDWLFFIVTIFVCAWYS